MKQRKQQTNGRKLYHGPFKSPIVIQVDTSCSQSTICTQSPSATTSLRFTNNDDPPLMHKSNGPVTSTPKKQRKRSNKFQVPSSSQTMESQKSNEITVSKSAPDFEDSLPSTPKRQSSIHLQPETPKTPTIRLKNSALSNPCTTPNRNQRRPEVQKYLTENLPRTPKKGQSLKQGVVKKKKKVSTPSKYKKLEALNKKNSEHDMLRYHYLTKSPSTKATSPARSVVPSESSHMIFEFQVSPRSRHGLFNSSCKALKTAAKQSVLFTIRKVAQELAELRKRRQMLHIEIPSAKQTELKLKKHDQQDEHKKPYVNSRKKSQRLFTNED